MVPRLRTAHLSVESRQTCPYLYSPAEVARSPLLGEHTDEIMVELGYGADEIAAAKNSGAV